MKEIIEDRIDFMEKAFYRRHLFVLSDETKLYTNYEVKDYELYGLNDEEFNS